ncbi:MAG TPA: 3'-5' exonuclease [Pedobacter sp.]|uniref:3'-5' exonuclease n=1 Tax=Pedobacter sp. TaxID=1411316 RepID=UPI002B979FAA|nr:3'-5' exonuclease [Pedobacter sp.]HMI01342.1 3'-5' exonuclease [Pedobacter sp.]
MKADKILFIDTETGGIDPASHSLLSLALVVWKELEVRASIEILVNDGVLNVTEKALEINGINLSEHKKKAVSPVLVLQQLDQFLDIHFSRDEKIILGGHNINFDVNFLNAFLTRNGYDFQRRFSHRYVDTSSILFYLYLTGKIKRKLTASQDAFDYFGITVQGRHTALGDAFATAQLFGKLVSILYRDSKGRSSQSRDMSDLFASQSDNI